jgi:hypothetical protein
VIGSPGRQTPFALGVVETELESRWVCIGMRGDCKSAKCDQQTLRFNRIRNEDTGQRSPRPLRPHTKFEHFVAGIAAQFCERQCESQYSLRRGNVSYWQMLSKKVGPAAGLPGPGSISPRP